MKQLLACATAVFLLAGTLHAAPLPKPFEEMTLEELRAVETDSLTKEQKKHHKNILKAAKKAEKARLKAEKARLKAEEKRRKEEEKKLRKARSKAAKRVKYIDKVRRETVIFKDDFAAHIAIRGDKKVNRVTSFSEAMTIPDATFFSLHALYYPQDNSLVLQAFVLMETREMLSEEDAAKMAKRPLRYANRAGVWRNYNRATLRGGKEVETAPLDRRAEVEYGVGKFQEDLRVGISMEDIKTAVAEGRDLDFKLYANRAPSLIITIPYDYLLGFGMRLSDLGSDIEIDRALFETPYRTLIEASGQ